MNAGWLLLIVLFLAAVTIKYWFRQILRFAQVESDMLQGLQSILQFALWLGTFIGLLYETIFPKDIREILLSFLFLIFVVAISVFFWANSWRQVGVPNRPNSFYLGHICVLVGSSLTLVTSSLAIANDTVQIIKGDPPKYIPKASIEPTPTSLAPTQIYPPCQLILGEWPCTFEVQVSWPRQDLSKIAKLVYFLEDPVDPIYTKHICDANWAMISRQFIKNIPPERRGDWYNDPCNYLVPGNILFIPPPPQIPS